MPETLPIPLPWLILLGYILLMSLISIIVCIYDKKISKKNNVKLRVPEKTLFILSALGGALAMFITMQLIRHKTKHPSFMIGIPVIFILHVALIVGLRYFDLLPPLFSLLK